MSDNKQIKTFGKGSKRRKENFKKVQDNWDQIKGFGKRRLK